VSNNRRGGRPYLSNHSTRIFAEFAGRIVAQADLTKHAAFGRLVVEVTWSGCGPYSVDIAIKRTRQNFGGWRRWFSCPTCSRRCRVLYSAGPGHTFTCGRCARIVRLARYPTRHALAVMFGRVPTFLDDRHGDLERRRVGRRRPRGVRRRRVRLLVMRAISENTSR
jgi:hypothetical protein